MSRTISRRTSGALAVGASALALVLAAAPALAASCPTATDPQGLKSAFPQQLELAEWQGQRGPLALKENPLFAAKVEAGELPPVAERLPAEPLVVLPYEDCGKHGGVLRGTALAPESGTSEILSWRQVNLVRISDDLQTLKPDVAKGWKWGDDYKSITFTLRKGHKWSDGAPFTADDIVFFINDIVLNKDLNPKVPAPWVVAGEPVSVEKVDDQTVTFRFAGPNPGFLYYLATSGSYFAPYAPKHHYMAYHASYNPKADEEAKAAGFGGWVDRFGKIYHKWKDAETLTDHALERPTLESHIMAAAPTTEGRKFIANPYYFKVDPAGQQLPYIERHDERYLNRELQQLAVLNGETDQKSQGLGLTDFPILKENEEKGGYVVHMPFGAAGPSFAFSMTHRDPKLAALYSDVRFREAISHAINRDEINETLFFGMGEPQQAAPLGASFVTPEAKAHKIEYDPAKANRLLDEIGMKKGPDGFRTLPDGTPYTLLWEYSSQFVDPALMRLMLDYFKAVGIKVNPKELTTEATRQNAKQDASDINMEWDVPFEPSLIADVRLFIPPYSEISPLYGLGWRKWMETSGAEGSEPPQWVKDLYALAEEWRSVEPGSERYKEIGRELVRINHENMAIIGTIGKAPRPFVVSKKLGNVPKPDLVSFNYGYIFPMRPDQWYYKGDR